MSMKDVVEKYEESRAALMAEIQVEFAKEMTEMLDKHSNVEAVVWTQYTPAWNDGEECLFSVGDVGIVLKEPGEEIYIEEDDDVVYYSKDLVVESIIKEFYDLVEEVPNDVLEHVLGNNVKVRCTREGITIDEYDCEY
jgi:hypothetical protein